MTVSCCCVLSAAMLWVPACTSDDGDRDAGSDPTEDTTTTTLGVAARSDAAPISGRVVAWTDRGEVMAVSPEVATTSSDEPVEVPVEVLASDVEVSPALSPDGTQLLLMRPSGLAVLDPVTGQESAVGLADEAGTRVVAADCLSWSPDGAQFAVRSVEGALYVATTAGDARLVDAPKEADYAVGIGGEAIPGAPSVTHRSAVSCGRWLDQARLVIQRVATMPESVYADPADPGAPVPSDTTSVAVLEAGGTRLVDFDDRWYLRDACGDRWVVTDRPDGTDPDGAGTDERPTDASEPIQHVLVDGTAELTAQGRGTGGELLSAGEVIERDALSLRPGTCDVLAHDASIGGLDILDESGDTQATLGVWPHGVQRIEVEITMDRALHAWEPTEGPVRFVHAKKGYSGLRVIDLAAGTLQALSVPGHSVATILGWAPT